MGMSLSRPMDSVLLGCAALLAAAASSPSAEAFAFVGSASPSDGRARGVCASPLSSSHPPSSDTSLSAISVDDLRPAGVVDANDRTDESSSDDDPASEFGRTFESLLDASASSSSSPSDPRDGAEDDSGLRAAEEMLLRTVDLYKNGGESAGGAVKPTEHAFGSLIEAWLGRAAGSRGEAAAAASSASKHRIPRRVLASDAAAEAASRAESLLDMMEELYEPDGDLYRGLISAWCSVAIRAHADREAEAAARAEEEDAKIRAKTANLGGMYRTDAKGEDGGEGDEDEDDGEVAEAVVDSRTAALRALSILDRLERLCSETGSDDLVPGLSTYSTVESAWRTLGEGGDAVPDAGRYLDEVRARRDVMHPPRDEDDVVASVPVESHGDVMRLLNRLEGADEVRGKFSYGRTTLFRDRKGKRVAHKTRRGVSPITLNYNIVIDALAKSGRVWAGQRTEDVLDYMVGRYRRHREGGDAGEVPGGDELKPDILTINSVIDAWARSPVPDSAERAEAVLDKLRNWQLEGILDDVHPDAATYNSLINGWCLSSSHASDAAERAEQVLAEMEELYDVDPYGDSSVKLDAVSYSSVLRAWAMQCLRKGSDPVECADRAERVFQRMHDRHRADPDANAAPDARCFNALLDVHANGGGTVSGQRAMKTLRLMEEFANAGNEKVRPDLYTYNTVLKALGNGGGHKAADRALELLERMEKWSSKGDEDKAARLRPDAVSYNTVIDALARRCDRPSAMTAERLMKGMDKGGIGCPKPNARTVAGVMNAWALSGERNAARVAEAIFDKMCNPDRGGRIVPDAVVYNTLLNAWAKSGDRSAAQRAMDILDRMEEDYRSGNVGAKPNVRTYTSALDALAKSQARWAPRRSEEILDHMERAYLAGEDESIRPNALSYTSVMNCWARSRDRTKAVRAQNILHRMEEQYRRGNGAARPNVVAYNVLLNACAYTGPAGAGGGSQRVKDFRTSSEAAADDAAAEEAFRIACLSFDELRTSKRIRPTHISYATFLNVCANLMPEGDLRDDLVRRIFIRCRGDGMTSDLVLRRLRGAVSSSDLYDKLLEGRSEDHLPADWTKNVSYRTPAVSST